MIIDFSLQRGYSLIEVLTSVVIFSVSMVALAGLSLTSLRSAADGQFNSQATFIAQELAEMMRANLTAYETGNFAFTPADTEVACAPGNTCTAEEQAQYDSGKWRWHAVTELPGGIAIMCMDSTPDDGIPSAVACDGGGLNTLKIFWKDDRSADALAQGETFQRHTATFIP